MIGRETEQIALLQAKKCVLQVKGGPMSIIWFLIIGLVAGWLAGMIMKGKGFGIIVNMVVGCIGAFVGGFAFSLLGLSAYGLIGSLVTATVGAIILLFLIRLIK
jgi:uncharacterized membrane protein YeaQ/YmgE (transglycosylase-associated protein family)